MHKTMILKVMKNNICYCLLFFLCHLSFFFCFCALFILHLSVVLFMPSSFVIALFVFLLTRIVGNKLFNYFIIFLKLFSKGSAKMVPLLGFVTNHQHLLLPVSLLLVGMKLRRFCSPPQLSKSVGKLVCIVCLPRRKRNQLLA